MTIHVSLLNTTQHTIPIERLGLESAYVDYAVQIVPLGAGAPEAFEYNQMLHKHKRLGSALSIFLQNIQPGGTFNEDIGLSAIDELGAPGDYAITVSREIEIAGKPVHVISNKITVTVQ